MNTLQEIRENLKREGAKKEDIKLALAIMVRLETLDGMVFPENPVTINFSIKRHRFGYVAGHFPDKSSETRYNIYLCGLVASLKEWKNSKSLWIPGNRKDRRLVRLTWDELLVSIAAHEVRHRVQFDYPLRKFSPRSSSLVKDEPLRSIIEFNELEFEERYKIYIREKKSKTFISERINRKEFDASTIERLVAHMVHRKHAYSLRKEIVAAIKLQAP